MEFPGFTAEDFDAYQPKKWSSNVFNLERLQVKQKLEALGRTLSGGLAAADGALLAFDVSVEHPALWNRRRVDAQHLFFSRNAEARRELESLISRQRSIASLIEDPSPLRNHILLSVTIDVEQVMVALKLHRDASVDRENLERKAAEFFEREKLLQQFHALPAGFSTGLTAGEAMPTGDLDDEGLQRVVAGLAAADSCLTVGRGTPRDAPRVGSPAFAEEVGEQLGALLPLMHAIAWTRDNDRLAIREALKEQEQRQAAKGLSKSDRVRVVRGVFTGKTGVVQETGAKGSIKVLIGKMAVKLSSADLVKL